MPSTHYSYSNSLSQFWSNISILWPLCPPRALNFFAFTWHSCAIETLMVASVAWLPPLWIFGWSTDRIGQFHWRFECHEGFWVWAWTSVLPLAFKSSNFCSLEWCNLYFSMKKTINFSFPGLRLIQYSQHFEEALRELVQMRLPVFVDKELS